MSNPIDFLAPAVDENGLPCPLDGNEHLCFVRVGSEDAEDPFTLLMCGEHEPAANDSDFGP